jgi:hypothetical protein
MTTQAKQTTNQTTKERKTQEKTAERGNKRNQRSSTPTRPVCGREGVLC